MSEAPRLIASISTLLTKRTTGVSSPLPSTPESRGSSSPASMSRLSRSSASPSVSVSVSCDCSHRSSVRRMLSSSTRIGSTTRLVWNFTSSSAWLLVGSDMPMKSLLPRLYSGSTWCLESSSSLTSLIALWFGSIADGSRIGMPNSIELAAAICAAVTSLCSRRYTATCLRWAVALSSASRAAASSSAPSRTRRRAMPVMPTRLAFTAAFIPSHPSSRSRPTVAHVPGAALLGAVGPAPGPRPRRRPVRGRRPGVRGRSGPRRDEDEATVDAVLGHVAHDQPQHAPGVAHRIGPEPQVEQVLGAPEHRGGQHPGERVQHEGACLVGPTGGDVGEDPALVEQVLRHQAGGGAGQYRGRDRPAVVGQRDH